MPEQEQYAMIKALGAAAAVAALVLLIHSLPWRAPRPRRVARGWLLGIGFGVYVGCWISGLKLRWPPSEILDRFLLILFPAVIGIELLAVLPKLPGWLVGICRFALAATAAPLLLYGSSHLQDLSVSNSAEWTPAQAWLTFVCLAIALSALWTLLMLLERRAPGVSLPMVMAFTCGAATVAVMLSGYATAGQLGVPLAAAVGGTAVVALANRSLRGTASWIGPALFGLFSLLIAGHFFAKLTAAHATLLFAAPLLAWLPEMPYLRRWPAWLRGALRVLLVASVLAVVVFRALQVFNAESLENYMDSGN